MAHRYVALRRAPPRRAEVDYDGNRLGPDTIQVIVEEDSPVETGLYDANGVRLFRITARRPVGFTVKHED